MDAELVGAVAERGFGGAVGTPSTCAWRISAISYGVLLPRCHSR